jgi:hypothetical protein
MPAPKPHDVPRVGTLAEVSYCRLCGAAFNDRGPCKPDGTKRDRSYYARNNL